jgi:hypothetical protein
MNLKVTALISSDRSTRLSHTSVSMRMRLQIVEPLVLISAMLSVCIGVHVQDASAQSIAVDASRRVAFESMKYSPTTTSQAVLDAPWES